MNKKDLIYIIVILLLLGGGYIGKKYYENIIFEQSTSIKKKILEVDELLKVNETQYTKLVDDTKHISELEDIVDSLGLELIKKPKIVYKTKIVYEEVEKPVDSVIVDEDVITIYDFYPNKENPFIEYTTEYDFTKGEGLSNWKLNPTDISIVLSQREDGIWKSDIQVPEYMIVGDVEVNATPLDIPKIDNFGWILGAGYGKDLLSTEEYIRISGGLRYKKIYLDIGATTKEQVDISAKFEF